jgi:hypothetical protein
MKSRSKARENFYLPTDPAFAPLSARSAQTLFSLYIKYGMPGAKTTNQVQYVKEVEVNINGEWKIKCEEIRKRYEGKQAFINVRGIKELNDIEDEHWDFACQGGKLCRGCSRRPWSKLL